MGLFDTNLDGKIDLGDNAIYDDAMLEIVARCDIIESDDVITICEL